MWPNKATPPLPRPFWATRLILVTLFLSLYSILSVSKFNAVNLSVKKSAISMLLIALVEL